MRLRNVKGSREAIASSEFTINEPETHKGAWNEVFGNDKPIHIEVGMGKGRFITDLAIANTDINYIGIEKWALGEWRANKPVSQDYVEAFKKLATKIDVEFVKVKAHSGVEFSELVDQLAKDAFK